MIIGIRDSSDIPIYLQIRNQIVQGISQGQLKPGDQLPTVRALAAETGVNSMTVSKAYQMLKQEGYICGDKRNGAHIREAFAPRKGLSQNDRDTLLRIISEAKIHGMTKSDFIKECEALFQEEDIC